ncbi:hypothetical protein Pla22_51790 [Rubripirellula amarantea]|uniref:OstA-like protein n=1 Tax=Rubripirellula amarantea TaxID=2527999 RepID=A0A5C5WBD5_9BACT|nr:hypothetical protein [Rubripirellula amarantea]TWT48178.1 hypothetical protein Pla22_51790 [Rubripirellula amarantea]
MARIINYFTALMFLLGTAIIYQNTFVPWLEPVAAQPVPARPAQELRGNDSLRDLFAEDSWQRGSCKCLQTSEGMLLFEKWEQSGGDQWKLWPVTVVLGRGISAKKDDQPIILEAAQGAEIKFTSSLDVMSGGAPPIDRGRMIGPVHIYRADPHKQNAESDRSIDLRTSNVGIDRKKLWTTDAIEMQFGRARMIGRDLTIHLAGNPISNSSGSPASILDRMELIYLDELVMPLEKSDATVEIQCSGRVEYDFAIDHLMMRDEVSLIHRSATGQVDDFRCDSIELGLNNPTDSTILRTGPLDWVNRIVAKGNPAAANLPSFDASITGDQIDVDVSRGRIEAIGKQGIRIRRGGISASLANLVYQFDPRDPKRIGNILVDGPGIVSIDDPEVAVRKAQWAGALEVKPEKLNADDATNANVSVYVEDDVQAWLVDGGEFSADNVEGILKSVDSKVPGERPSLAPEQFDIKGNVRINTTAIAADTQRLRLFFVDDERAPVPRKAAPPASPLRQWVSQPTTNNLVDQPSSAVAPVARSRPEVSGDIIIAQLRRTTTGLSAKQLKVEGNVRVSHKIEANGQNLDTVLTGELLQLLNHGGEDVLQLGSGIESPARFEIGDGFFVGPEIQIRPRENIIWIKDAGEFQLPSNALPTGLAGQNGSSKIQWIKPPYCRWQGEMLFDGRKIQLTDGVDISAAILNGTEPWEFKMSGERLEVDLWDDVNLQDMAAVRQARVQAITLLKSNEHPVFVEAFQRAADGVLEAKHLLYAHSITMSPGMTAPQFALLSPEQRANASVGSGKIVGEGPGWYRAWVPSPSEGPMQHDQTATMVDDAERPLTGIHLTYNDQMTADLTTRALTFERGVRVGSRSVTHWEDTFNAAEMTALGVGESTLDCDQLRVAMEPPLPGRPAIGVATIPWEMQAISGVVFRTRSDKGLLEGTASRAAYAASKDMFTAQGAPSRPAIIRRSLPDGTPQLETAVRSMVIRPRTMTIDSMEFERGSVATPTQGISASGAANRR